METYVIRRTGAWSAIPELQTTAAKSARIGDEEMPDKVKWIRSYVVREPDGRIGTVCIYQATDVDAIRDHARRVGMPGDDVLPVLDTVVVRSDPVQPTQAAE